MIFKDTKASVALPSREWNKKSTSRFTLNLTTLHVTSQPPVILELDPFRESLNHALKSPAVGFSEQEHGSFVWCKEILQKQRNHGLSVGVGRCHQLIENKRNQKQMCFALRARHSRFIQLLHQGFVARQWEQQVAFGKLNAVTTQLRYGIDDRLPSHGKVHDVQFRNANVSWIHRRRWATGGKELVPQEIPKQVIPRTTPQAHNCIHCRQTW